MQLGLYSLKGLDDIALVYGFGPKSKFTLKKQLVLCYNKHPCVPDAAEIAWNRRQGLDQNSCVSDN